MEALRRCCKFTEKPEMTTKYFIFHFIFYLLASMYVHPSQQLVNVEHSLAL